MQLSNPFKPARSITGSYGKRPSFQLPNGQWTLPFHYGVDFAAPAGTPIYASYPGKVVHSGWDYSGYGGGWQIAIEYGEYRVYYLHMRAQSHLKTGANVKRGQHIGYVGSTGASTGPHLHEEVHRNGTPINPAPLFTYKEPKPVPKKESKVPAYFSAWRSKKSAGKSKAVTTKWGKGTQTCTPGKQNHLILNNEKDNTVAMSGNYDLTVTLHVTGTPGDYFTLGSVRGTWSKNAGWKEKAWIESVQGRISESGEEKIQLSISNVVPAGQRLRFYVHPSVKSSPVVVERFSVKGRKW